MTVEHRSAGSLTLLDVVALLFKAAEVKEDDIVQKYQELALLWSTVFEALPPMVYIRHLRVWKYPVERLLSEAGVTGYMNRGIGLDYETRHQGLAFGSNGT